MWDFLQNLFTALLPIVTAFAGWAGARIRNTNQKDKAVERGVKMLLRAKIIDLGLHYLEVGEIPPYGKLIPEELPGFDKMGLVKISDYTPKPAQRCECADFRCSGLRVCTKRTAFQSASHTERGIPAL